MAVEIERRFLVAGNGWRRHVLWEQQLQQGYLLSAPDGLTVRVRLSHALSRDPAAPDGCSLPLSAPPPAEAKAWLTLKAKLAGEAPAADLSRHEFEYAIPASDASELLALCGSRLSKRRHGLDLPGGDWVLDVFEAENAPLVVAEVEIASPDAVVPVPEWCVQELSGRHALSNAALARRPLRCWSPAERSELLAVALNPPGAGRSS